MWGARSWSECDVRIYFVRYGLPSAPSSSFSPSREAEESKRKAVIVTAFTKHGYMHAIKLYTE